MNTLLAQLRRDGLSVSSDGGHLYVAPRNRLTDQLRAKIREHKAVLLADLNTEAQGLTRPGDIVHGHDELLRMLEARPEIKRAFLAGPLPNGGGLVRLAVRDIGTCDLVIPAGRYDPMAIKMLFDDLERDSGSAN